MLWPEIKHILIDEIQQNLNSKFSSILKNSYPLLKNRSYGIVEFAIISTLSESDKWTVRDISGTNDFGTTSDVVFNYEGYEFPVSIKTSIATKSGVQLLHSRTQVEAILTALEYGNMTPLSDCPVFSIPIISIDYRDGEMLLCIKEHGDISDKYIEWTADLPKTASFKDGTGKSLLTFSRKKGNIVAYDGFFENVIILKERCSEVNMILYKIVNLLQSEENHQGFEENIQNLK